MTTLRLEDAPVQLAELVDQLRRGEALVLTRGGEPVARLLAAEIPERPKRKPGGASGLLFIMAEDDEHLNDFEDYMS